MTIRALVTERGVEAVDMVQHPEDTRRPCPVCYVDLDGERYLYDFQIMQNLGPQHPYNPTPHVLFSVRVYLYDASDTRRPVDTDTVEITQEDAYVLAAHERQQGVERLVEERAHAAATRMGRRRHQQQHFHGGHYVAGSAAVGGARDEEPRPPTDQ
jgi:hypothetical protein